MVKKYVLRRADARALIDLKDNEGVIKRAYYMINHDLYVAVFRDYYIVIGKLTNGQARGAGRIVAKSSLGKYARRYPKGSSNPSTVQLFMSVSLTEEEKKTYESLYKGEELLL